MPDLDQVTAVAEPTTAPLLLSGLVASAPDANKMITVKVPGFSRQQVFGPMRHAGTRPPIVGDRALIMEDNEGEWWATAIWPGSTLPGGLGRGDLLVKNAAGEWVALPSPLALGGGGYSLRHAGGAADPSWQAFDSSVRGLFSAAFPLLYNVSTGGFSLQSASRGALITFQTGFAVPNYLAIGKPGTSLKSSGDEPAWQDSAKHISIAPDIAYQSSVMAPVNNRAYFLRFIPLEDGIITGIQFMVAVASTSDQVCSVGAYQVGADGELSRIAATLDRAGHLNVTPDQDVINIRKYSIAVPRAAVFAGLAYYAAVRFNTAGGVQLVSALKGRDAMIESSHSETKVGLAPMLMLSPGTLAATITRAIAAAGATAGTYEAPVVAVSYQKRIVALGDSITNPGPVMNPYSRSLNALLGRHAYIVNAGVGGDTIALINARFTADVTNNRPQEVIVFCGINDITADRTSAQIIADLTALYASCAALGATVRPVTILPFGGHGLWTAARELVRDEVNAFIMTQPLKTNMEGILDDGNATQPALLNPQYSTDNLHPTDAGHTEMAKQMYAQSYLSLKTERPKAI